MWVLPLKNEGLPRAVIKRQGPRISPGILLKEHRRKIKPIEFPSCLIPCLLVLFTPQLEILVTTLPNPEEYGCTPEEFCGN